MFDSVPRWFFYGVIAVYLIIVMTIIVVFADDTEDKGRSTMIDQLTKRVQEWNIQKAMNDSLAIADRFNCEYDESLCVLGIPDPDFNDIGVCFNSPELAEQYFKQTGINGTVPCPDFSISGIPKDESGK